MAAIVLESSPISKLDSEILSTSCCHKTGPGYAPPIKAMSSPLEKLIYVTCVYNGTSREKPDYLAIVDVDPSSPTYSEVIHRLPVTHIGDELHHSGWNACSSCHGDLALSRRHLILPSLLSSRICVIDTQKNPREPSLHKVVDNAEILRKTGLAYPHTSHRLASGGLLSWRWRGKCRRKWFPSSSFRVQC